MIADILKKFKELRSLVGKFVSSGQKDPEAFLAKIKTWTGEFEKKIDNELKPGKKGDKKEDEEEEDKK